MQMFNFLSFLMSLLHSIPLKHAIHFLACITLDLISLSSVPLVSKITPKYLYSWQNSILLSLPNFKLLCVPQYTSILFYSNSCQGPISRKFLLIYVPYTPNLLYPLLKLIDHLQTEVYTVLYFLNGIPFHGIYVSILLKLFLCKS